MKNKVILTIAPTGNIPTKSMNRMCRLLQRKLPSDL